MTEPLILQVARGGGVHRQMDIDPPPTVSSGDVVIEALAPESGGHLEAPDVGEVVLSVPSPETLARERDNVRRVITQAGSGIEPLVILVEAAAELRDEEVAAVVDGARHAARPLILRVLRDG